ncbi:hypothetical protein CAPTEDRAFT_186225 [Capitella teleta]|uniref:PNPLA domain-containing protein n=1 Tax=Capitella teleta TaxID=283909 RepID=R7U4Q0_CAPTE|nr:hypothetical protein CAPTEDRAFT_186225 [Capitella teleta]|eukprot:ELT98671.1 hypothetical protein CAPTEDRAFT_186225 [Capitella teleta]
MGNGQSGEFTLEEEPRRRKRKGKGKKPKPSHEIKLIESTDEKYMKHEEKINFRFDQHSFAFENIVLEGGGQRIVAHCGVIKALEEANIFKHLRRFAGSGSGALIASLACVGFDSRQIERFLNEGILQELNDHSCGTASFVPKLRRNYGWNAGKKFYKSLRKAMKQATGRPDVTFMEVQKSFNRELCVVVTNLSQSILEYCHPKTTPDMPIATAVRMALATPGTVQPVWQQIGDEEDFFADGSLLCSYPLHCFDGWWLSLDHEDNFLQKLNPLKHLPRLLDQEERFGDPNNKTIGVMLYSDLDQDIFSSLLEQRNRFRPARVAETELRLAYDRQQASKHRPSERFTTFAVALDYFMEALRENDLDQGAYLTRKDLQNVINKRGCLTDKDLEALFGDRRVTADDIFSQLQATQSDQARAMTAGLPLQQQYLLHRKKTIKGIEDFFSSWGAALTAASRSAYLKKSDVERSIGVNCQHIDTSVDKLEESDKEFLLQTYRVDRESKQGSMATKSFLQHYLTKRSLPMHSTKTQEDVESFTREEFLEDELSEIIDVGDYSENHITKVT